jgi:hypothetical protein
MFLNVTWMPSTSRTGIDKYGTADLEKKEKNKNVIIVGVLSEGISVGMCYQ